MRRDSGEDAGARSSPSCPRSSSAGSRPRGSSTRASARSARRAGSRVIVKQLADRQPDLNEEVVGPPVSAAFAPDGTLTKAGRASPRRTASRPESLAKKEVAGQEGPVRRRAARTSSAQDARGLLPELLARARRAAIAWPKSHALGLERDHVRAPGAVARRALRRRGRPARVGRADGRPQSRGHRFLSPGRVEIATRRRVRRGAARGARRRRSRRAQAISSAPSSRGSRSETGLRVRPDDALLDEVIHLGEYPVGVSRRVRSVVPRGPRGDHRHRDAHAPALLRDGGRERASSRTGSRR